MIPVPIGMVLVACAVVILAACSSPPPTPTVGVTALEQRLARTPVVRPLVAGSPERVLSPPSRPTPLPIPTEPPPPTLEPGAIPLRGALRTPVRALEPTSAVVAAVEYNSKIALQVGTAVEWVDLTGLVPVERVHASRAVDCFLSDANRVVRDFLPIGANVDIEIDPVTPRDKDGRLRVGIWPRANLLLNVELILQGLGSADMTQRDTRYHAAQRDAELEARLKYRGVWSDLMCIDKTVWIGRR